MALTITVEGKGVIANADSLTADTAGGGLGDWIELGGGGIAVSGVNIQGGTSIAGAYSNKDGWQYFDILAGNELDFTVSTGTEEGQHVYLWVQMPALAQLDTLANNGLRCRLGSSTTDYREWTIASNDDSNGWLGGWQCFVIDPTKTGTVTDTGTFDIANVRMFGFYLNTSSTGRGDNFFADRIVVGKGLRITGTSTQTWQDIVDYCIASATVLGMVQEREGIIYLLGKLWFGDATNQAANNSFVDSGKVLKFATSEYYNGTSWVSSMDVDNCGIVIEDHASYTTVFQDGVIVGTDNGRSGSTFIGNDNEDITLDLYGGNHADSVTLMYGTKFEKICGAFNSGNDAQHKFLGCNFIGSSKFDPVGAPVIRNCTFAETKDIDAALLWNESIDIQNCSFLANTLGAAIEHPSAAGTPYGYTDLIFADNTFDGLNSSGTNITVNKNGTSNPSTDEGANTITYVGSVPISIKVQNEAKVVIENAQTSVHLLDSPYTELMNEDTLATGLAEATYTDSTPVDVVIKVRKAEDTDTPKYYAYSDIATLTSDGLSRTITLEEK